MRTRLLLTALLVFLGSVGAAHAFTIYLKDGSRIEAQEAYRIEGDKAIITLMNGTPTFIDASEIDAERTKKANISEFSGTLVLKDGKFVEMKEEERAEVPQKERLADLIARGSASATSKPSAEEMVAADVGPAVTDRTQRIAYRNFEAAEILRNAFTQKGLGELYVQESGTPATPLIEVVTNSESAVFRSLEAAAAALEAVRTDHPEIEGLELVMLTSNQEPAGEFVLTAEMAMTLAARDIDLPTFFIENVRF